MIEKGKISAYQFAASISCFIMSSGLVISFFMRVTRQDSWMIVPAGFLITLLLVLVYSFLLNRFPGKNLIEINDIVFGPVFGRVISVLYLFFFFSVTCLNLRDMGNFVSGFILTETPLIAVIAVFVYVIAWAARNGIETIARGTSIIIVVTGGLILFNTFLLLENMDLKNLLPMFAFSLKEYVQSTHIATTIPLGEIFVFTMIAPFVKEPEKVKRSYILGLTFGASFLQFILIRYILVLGPLNAIVVLPNYESVRLIEIGNIITRNELLYGFLVILMLYIKISILFYATILGASQVLRLKSYKPLAAPFGVIAAIFAVIVFDSAMEHAFWGLHASAPYATLFQIILPLVTAVAALRKNTRQAAQAGSAQKA